MAKAKYDTELDWTNVEITELPIELQQAYKDMKAQYKIYAEKKAAFQHKMQVVFANNLGEEQELKFGYKFGKLSIAIGEKREAKPKKEAKQAQSFADWLKRQRESGRDH